MDCGARRGRVTTSITKSIICDTKSACSEFESFISFGTVELRFEGRKKSNTKTPRNASLPEKTLTQKQQSTVVGYTTTQSQTSKGRLEDAVDDVATNSSTSTEDGSVTKLHVFNQHTKTPTVRGQQRGWIRGMPLTFLPNFLPISSPLPGTFPEPSPAPLTSSGILP